MDDKFLDNMPGTPPPPKKGKPTFNSGLGTVTKEKSNKAAGKGKYIMHGRYKQVLVRLLPEDAQRVDNAAAQLGLNKEDTKRWLILRGLQAFDEGEVPEMEPVQTMRLKRP